MAEIISFQAKDGTRDSLKGRAAKLGITVSELIRRQVEDTGPFSEHVRKSLEALSRFYSNSLEA